MAKRKMTKGQIIIR